MNKKKEEKENVLLLGSFKDRQTAWYIALSFQESGYRVDGIDIRVIVNKEGIFNAQPRILKEIDVFETDYDLIIVFKGLELHMDTLKKLREKFPKAKIVNWFFDKYLVDKPIWEQTEFFEAIKFYDYFFCSLKGVADKLKEAGFENVRYLDEGCYPNLNKGVYLNAYQRKKYGSDVTFIGSIGFLKQHSNRVKILTRLAEEGFDLKIWGPVVCEWKLLPPILKTVHTNKQAINLIHSMVVEASIINLGIDQDPDIELGFSARLYRVLCAGGLYLTTYCKGMENMFKINKKGEKITGEEDLLVYYDEEDLIGMIDFLLKNEELCKKIGRNGQRTVLTKHTFIHRIMEMKEVIKNGNKK